MTISAGRVPLLFFTSLLLTFLTDFLAQHRRIVPGESQLRVRGVPSKQPKRFSPMAFVVEKHIPFLSFDQCQYVDVLTHGVESFAGRNGVNFS